MMAPIDTVLDEGGHRRPALFCGRGTDRGEEACDWVRKCRPDVAAGHILVKAARLRTEAFHKAGVSIARYAKLRLPIETEMGYFGLASQLKLFDRLDQWMRRRIRMCYWKQWRRPKRRREMLIRLGVPRRQAIRHARSRQSYWHMSRTIASGVGLTNAWLAEQGLISMKTLWAQLAPLRGTA
ncbi:MAG: hypothetical protein KatS3mg105_5098 [Gemmatales bacterium]|nr:MAG: hypothetical protein KatS3mg105_5098 [Gemmatales bacterium]